MTTSEHLDAIDAECTRLLAIAEKRTPEWAFHQDQDYNDPSQDVFHITDKWRTVAVINEWGTTNEAKKANATFIAACAGTAEAGWRSTRIAIIAARSTLAPEGMFHPDNPIYIEDTQAVEALIAQWPIETLNIPSA